MSNNDVQWMAQATELAGEVYQSFLAHVVNNHVLRQREGGSLNEASKKKIDAGQTLDHRRVHLMSISGKGGWDDDAEKFERYAKNSNVTLLDHLLSVVRGSLIFYALDYMSQNHQASSEPLTTHLKIMAAIAFLHDLDKDLKLVRNTALPLNAVENALNCYGLDSFLRETCPTPEQMRYLIEKVEDTQAHFHTVLVPQAWEGLSKYVALADKLDGIWLADDGGIDGVLDRLHSDETLHCDHLKHWHIVRLYDPHHPFLLDELQRWISFACWQTSKIVPLIELHHDGELLMLIPEKQHTSIIETSIQRVCNHLPFDLMLNISTRGNPSLHNKRPSFEALNNFIEELTDRELGKLLQIKAGIRDAITVQLDEMLTPYGLAPVWPNKDDGLITMYTKLDRVDKQLLFKAALLCLSLNLTGSDTNTATFKAREQKLFSALHDQVADEWISNIEDRASRFCITSLWLVTLGQDNNNIDNHIWGDNGLLAQWWNDDEQSLTHCIEGVEQFNHVQQQLQQRLQQLLTHQRVVAKNETATGHCLFTDEPVPFTETIDSKSALYSVKASAFSGRDGRPEGAKAHTNVSAVSLAEHKLRKQAHKQQGGKDEGVPTLISSPSVSGLFSSLKIPSDKNLRGLSIYDLNRLDIKKGVVYRGIEVHQSRYRMARLEALSTTTKGQISQLRMLLTASLRIGRPFHLFRGLPIKNNAFFYYDAMPRLLEDLLGHKSLRLEQIPQAIERLNFGQTVIEEHGLGYDVLRLYAQHNTRFAATCFIWCHLRNKEHLDHQIKNYLDHEFIILKEDEMNNHNGALITLGALATTVQQAPFGKSSTSEEMLSFDVCMDTAITAMALGQTDSQSMSYAIAGELEKNLGRKEKVAAGKYRTGTLREACLQVAEHFVLNVWLKVLSGKPASQRNRRVLGSIYRMSFLHTIATRNSQGE